LLNAKPRAWDRRCNRQAPRATDGQALREQFKHLQAAGCAISLGTRPLNGEATTAVMPCILLCRSSSGSPQQTTNPLRPGEEDRNDALHFFPCHFLHLVAGRSACSTGGTETLRRGKTLWPKLQIGRPHFFGFQPPKKFVGSSSPPARAARGRVFTPTAGKQEFCRTPSQTICNQ
jgi:hypothetical protein